MPFSNVVSRPKSLYVSQAVRHFYETEVEIWAGVSEIKLRYATCEGSYVFMDKTNNN